MTGFPEPDMDKDNCQVMEYGRNKNRREETQIIYKQHKPHREKHRMLFSGGYRYCDCR